MVCCIIQNYLYTAKPAPVISYVRPRITTNISKAEKLEHFCHFIVKPGDKSLHYTVEWSLSDGSSMAKQLFIGTATKNDEKKFNDTTKLTEAHLSFNGIVKLGYTVTTDKCFPILRILLNNDFKKSYYQSVSNELSSPGLHTDWFCVS